MDLHLVPRGRTVKISEDEIKEIICTIIQNHVPHHEEEEYNDTEIRKPQSIESSDQDAIQKKTNFIYEFEGGVFFHCFSYDSFIPQESNSC